MQIKSVKDADVAGKRVLLCVDFNVPLKEGRVADDMRIRAALPTISLLRERGAKQIVILSHLGRPDGKVVEGLRMAPVEARLREFVPNAPDIVVHENLRFDPREEANDLGFAKELASLGDLFVNDAFSDSHRAHASIVGIAALLPSYAGLLMEEEIAKLSEALAPAHPSLAIIGGAKFETKIPLLIKLVSMYDHVLLGGALASDMLKARGSAVGSSLVSGVPVPTVLAGDERIEIPIDLTVLDSESNMSRNSQTNDVHAAEKTVDIGSATAALWSKKIKQSQFVLWNGPVGIYEQDFGAGTDALAKAIAEFKGNAVIGGGDTDAALAKVAFDASQVFISTGGGAMLEFLENGTLPGIEALRR
ncbi:MAG TPA: phosphoglycerate kinase [Candidatus Paceibacterota bacterium]